MLRITPKKFSMNPVANRVWKPVWMGFGIRHVNWVSNLVRSTVPNRVTNSVRTPNHTRTKFAHRSQPSWKLVWASCYQEYVMKHVTTIYRTNNLLNIEKYWYSVLNEYLYSRKKIDKMDHLNKAAEPDEISGVPYDSYMLNIYIRHVVSGTIFILVGLWTMSCTFYRYFLCFKEESSVKPARQYENSLLFGLSWFPGVPVDSIVFFVGSIIGIIGEYIFLHVVAS